MPRATTNGRLDRLDLLASRLKAEEAMTVGGLAAEFSVSPRTLFRDIDLLRARGLPIEADRGRGGGVRLHRMWGVGRINLDYREAIGLLVSLAIAEQLPSPWLFAGMASIRHKLSASFSPTLRDRIAGLRSRIHIGRSASAPVIESFSAPQGVSIDALFRAFLETRLLRFRYVDNVGRRSDRCVEPQLLLLNYPVWYLVAWDRERDAVRSFRCDRITEAIVDERTFRIRSGAVYAEAMEGIGAIAP